MPTLADFYAEQEVLRKERQGQAYQGHQPFDNTLHTYTYTQKPEAAPVQSYYGTYYGWPSYAYSYPQYYASAATYAPAATYTPAVTYVPATTYAQAPAYHYYLPHYYYPSGTDGRDVGCAPGTGYHHTYYGRTKEEVDAENRRLATAGGAYDAHEIRPHNPKPDQQFWCREKDGQLTLRTFYTIENDLHPGRWQMGAEKGNLIFVRE